MVLDQIAPKLIADDPERDVDFVPEVTRAFGKPLSRRRISPR